MSVTGGDMIHAPDLFDISHTLAAGLVYGCKYPRDILSGIIRIIREEGLA